MPEIKLNFKLGSRHNLAANIRWLIYLNSGRFAEDFQADYELTKNQVDMLKEVDAIIMEEIYSYPEGSYQRTYDLRESFQAVELSMHGTERGIAIYSDPMIAPSEAGDRKGQISYAAFFEDPEFNTFIPDQEERPAIRPFFGLMETAIHKLGEERILKSLKRILQASRKAAKE